jgi:hypothetical protein
VALPVTLLKSISRQKEELWKLKYFSMQKYIIFKTILLKKKNQNPSRYDITNVKFEHKPKYHLSKILK